MAQPTADYILEAIDSADSIDPDAQPACWECILYSTDGQRAGDGHAFTVSKAIALAWLKVWNPDALSGVRRIPDLVPFIIPPGWRFELTYLE
jgi:hypothetical protein